MKNTKRGLLLLEAALLIGFVATFAAEMIPFAQGCGNIRENMLRLHVIANSDTPRDQQLKLLVRDAVLQAGAEVFDGSADVESAEARLVPAFPKLEQAAEKVLRRNGCADEVQITLAPTYFETRTYGERTVPAGVYQAVCVRIGKAQGKNWWCVMFPPLCLPAVTAENPDAVFSRDGQAVLGSSPKYDVRFKVVEVYQNLKAKCHA